IWGSVITSAIRRLYPCCPNTRRLIDGGRYTYLDRSHAASAGRQPGDRRPRDVDPGGPVGQLVPQLVDGLVQLEGREDGVEGRPVAGQQGVDALGGEIAVQERTTVVLAPR